MRFWPILAFAAVWAMPAFAADIPLDDAGFTGFVQAKLQLYTHAKVGSDTPLTLAVGPVADMELDFNLHEVHDRCVAAPAKCDGTVHDYVQEAVVTITRAEQRGSPPAPALEPSDEDAFTRDVAARASALAPGVSIVADGGTVLAVTRQGGHPFRFNVKSLYQDCRRVAFACAEQVRSLVERMAAYLDMPARGQLRAAPGFVRGCTVVASVGNSVFCRIRPSPAPMVDFFRRAFSNLAAYCFKETPHGVLVAINADRADLGLSVDEAVDLCMADTHAILPPLASRLDDAPGVGRIEAPWAASYALFADDWASFAATAGGHFLIAVPARNVLLYVKGDGEEQQRALAAAAMDVALHNPSPISTDVYRWTGSGFTLGTDTSTMTHGLPVVEDLMPREP